MCITALYRRNKCRSAVIPDLTHHDEKWQPYVFIFQLKVLLHHNAHWEIFSNGHYDCVLFHIDPQQNRNHIIQHFRDHGSSERFFGNTNVRTRGGRTQAQTCHPLLASSAPPQGAFIGSTCSWPRIEDVCLQHQLYFNKVVPSLAFP